MQLSSAADGTGTLTFHLNGEEVPGQLTGLPMGANGCQGLTPCASLAAMGDAVRLYWGERVPQGGSPLVTAMRRGSSASVFSPERRSPWGAWADSVRITAGAVTAVADGEGCACVRPSCLWSRG